MDKRVHPLAGAEIALLVGGGIAAYKAAELCRQLIKADARVTVVMTRGAQEFIRPLTLQTLSGRPVVTELFDLGQESEIGHIQLADRAALLLVAPATANLIARLAAGMADEAATAIALATRAPLLLAPSMNVHMWDNPLTQRNVRTLVELRGARTVGPDDGFLACKWEGAGRLADPAAIVEAAARVLADADLEGRTIVVTAAGTREAIDPVRFIGNRSTGRMGFALAAAAARRGARAILISGPSELATPAGVERRNVTTAAEMDAAVSAAAADADAVIMAAAVADFRPRAVSAQKIKKADGGATPRLELERTVDILARLGASREVSGRPALIGFAAETENVEAAARAKLASKRCDLIVANDVSQSDAGFGSEENRVLLIDSDGTERVELASKDAIAQRILDRLLRLLTR